MLDVFLNTELNDSFLYHYMDDDLWLDVKYFKPNSGDNFGEPNKMKAGIIWFLDKLRERAGVPITVISGTGGTHIAGSFHFKGEAVDIFSKLPLLQLYLLAELFPFTGIGIYPNMNSIHLDIGKGKKRPARWIGLKDTSGKIHYVPLNSDTFTQHIVHHHWDPKFNR